MLYKVVEIKGEMNKDVEIPEGTIILDHDFEKDVLWLRALIPEKYGKDLWNANRG